MKLGFGVEKLTFLKENADNKLEESIKEKNILLDSRIQVNSISQNISKYIDNSLQQVSGDSNLESVVNKLANNLLEIKTHVNTQSQKLLTSIEVSDQKTFIYKENLELISKCLDEALEEERKHIEITEKIKEGEIDSQNLKERKVGARPEKLKDVRRAEQQLKLQDNFHKQNN